MVESISKRYKLFDDWRKTGVCTLVGDERAIVEAERRRNIKYLAVSLLLLSVAVAFVVLSYLGLHGEIPSSIFCIFFGILVCSPIYIGMLMDCSYKQLMKSTAYDREYTLNNGSISVDGESYQVYLVNSCKDIIIEDTVGKQYKFDLKLDDVEAGVIKIHWGALKVMMSLETFHSIKYNNEQ